MGTFTYYYIFRYVVYHPHDLNQLTERDILVIGTSELTGYQTPRLDSSDKSFINILNEDKNFPYHISVINNRLFMTDTYYFLKYHKDILKNKKILISLNGWYLSQDWFKDTNEKLIFTDIGGAQGTRIFNTDRDLYMRLVFQTPQESTFEARIRNKLSPNDLVIDPNVTQAPYVFRTSIPPAPVKLKDKLEWFIKNRFLVSISPGVFYYKRPINYNEEIRHTEALIEKDSKTKTDRNLNVRKSANLAPHILNAFKNTKFMTSDFITYSLFAMAELAKKYNIRLVILLSPANTVFEKKIGRNVKERKEYYAFIVRRLNEMGVLAIDPGDAFPIKGSFIDNVHLNTVGAYYISQKLKPVLMNYFGTKNR